MVEIVLRDTRLQLARTLLALLRILHRAQYGGDDKFGRHIDEILISTAVFMSDAEGRPMTPHKLAEFLGVPRTTLLRKLNTLERRGWIELRRSGVRVVAKRVNRDANVAATREMMQLLESAVRELSKTDKKALDRMMCDPYPAGSSRLSAAKRA